MTAEELKSGLVIAIDKPVGWSSFQVVNKLKWRIRHQTGIKNFKIGHAGTLDPLASGLLLVCVGAATKQIEQLQQGLKSYSGTIVIGATTPSFDRERAIDSFYPTAHLNEALIRQAASQFHGTLMQTPPLFSAVKQAGRRAYSAARSGENISLKPKEVTIYDFKITNIKEATAIWQYPPSQTWNEQPTHIQKQLYKQPQGTVPPWLPSLDFEITCSKGTYIRSIARDLGSALGSGAFLASLRRTRIGNYTIDQAEPLSDDPPHQSDIA